MYPATRAATAVTHKFGRTLTGDAPKFISLWRASIVQPVGNASASFCVHNGVISMGHQHPPRPANTLLAITPNPMTWPSVRPKLPSNIPSAAASDPYTSNTSTTIGRLGLQRTWNNTVPAIIANAIWITPNDIRAPHFPSTTAPLDMGD